MRTPRQRHVERALAVPHVNVSGVAMRVVAGAMASWLLGAPSMAQPPRPTVANSATIRSQKASPNFG